MAIVENLHLGQPPLNVTDPTPALLWLISQGPPLRPMLPPPSDGALDSGGSGGGGTFRGGDPGGEPALLDIQRPAVILRPTASLGWSLNVRCK